MTSFTIVWAFDTPAGPIKKGTSYRKHCKHYHLVDVVKAQQQQLQISFQQIFILHIHQIFQRKNVTVAHTQIKCYQTFAKVI